MNNYVLLKMIKLNSGSNFQEFLLYVKTNMTEGTVSILIFICVVLVIWLSYK
jgi:hypothetical protein